jgi:hypothetical protein
MESEMVGRLMYRSAIGVSKVRMARLQRVTVNMHFLLRDVRLQMNSSRGLS